MKINIRSKSFASLFKPISSNDSDGLNIFSRYKLIETYKTDIKYYEEYTITSFDRWDILADNFYGDANLWWIISIFNSIIDPFVSFEAGKKINIIKSQYLPEILRAIKRLKNGR